MAKTPNGKVQVNSVDVSPIVTCGALTTVTVTGDGFNQRVEGNTLTAAKFALKPHLVATMGAGSDVVYETLAADSVDMSGRIGLSSAARVAWRR